MSFQAYSTNLGLSSLPEIDQKQHPQIWADLKNIRNALKILQGALDSYTGATVPNPSDFSGGTVGSMPGVFCVASEAIAYGNVVYLYDNGGVLTAQKASAVDSTKPARALCVTPGGVAIGAIGQFVFQGTPACFSGVTRGTNYYLSVTPGLITSVIPSGGTAVAQLLGFGLSTTQIWFNP
jgi:hypothetical protein